MTWEKPTSMARKPIRAWMDRFCRHPDTLELVKECEKCETEPYGCKYAYWYLDEPKEVTG